RVEPLPTEIRMPGRFQARDVPEEQRLHLVVYVDNFNIRPFNRNRVFRRLRTFLREHVTEDDRVMLVSYDRSLNLRQPFTNDASLINSALFELEDVSGHGVHADSERRRLLQAIEDAEEPADAMLQLRPYAESLYNDLSFTLDALEEMIESLAGLEGRKAILYVSDGVPMKAGEELFYMVQQKFGYTPVITQMMDFDASREYRSLANKASSNGVVFYAIDAGGLRTLSSASVETAEAGLPGMSSFIDSIYIQNIQEPLRFMADATGGYAIINTNDVSDDLLRIGNDFDTYYSLGYTPAHTGDGRLHRIEVKLKDGQKGLRIRHRTTYRAKSSSTRMVEGTLAALRYGFVENPLGVLLQVGQATRRDDDLFLVPIRVGIPLGEIVLVPREEHYLARTRLFIGAADDEEGISEVSDIEVPIRIPTAQYEEVLGKYFPFETTLLMRGGPHQVAVGLRDELGATESYVTETFFVEGR
ncbi:MAG: VWA domain-containing protein, partial [Thermoanaerobaculia bacterium]|nr:VWA domain-containing protein [Thermoanaerobaculia bacterium]